MQTVDGRVNTSYQCYERFAHFSFESLEDREHLSNYRSTVFKSFPQKSKALYLGKKTSATNSRILEEREWVVNKKHFNVENRLTKSIVLGSVQENRGDCGGIVDGIYDVLRLMPLLPKSGPTRPSFSPKTRWRLRAVVFVQQHIHILSRWVRARSLQFFSSGAKLVNSTPLNFC